MGKPKNTRKAISNVTDQFITYDSNLEHICLPGRALNIKVKNIIRFKKEESLEADLKLTINLGKTKKKLSPRLLVQKIVLGRDADTYRELDVIALPATSIEGTEVVFDIDKSGYLKPEYVNSAKDNIVVLSSFIYLPYGDKTPKEDRILIENKVVSEIFNNILKEANKSLKGIKERPIQQKFQETLESISIDEKLPEDKISFENLKEEKKENIQVTELVEEDQEDKISGIRNILICIVACIIAFTLGVVVKGLI